MVEVEGVPALPEIPLEGQRHGQRERSPSDGRATTEVEAARKGGQAPDLDPLGTGSYPSGPAAQGDIVAPGGLSPEQASQVDLGPLVARKRAGIGVQDPHPRALT